MFQRQTGTCRINQVMGSEQPRPWKKSCDYFFAPRVLFFSLIWPAWHFLHLVAEIGFLPPHLKNSLRCCAICFLVASVIGMFVSACVGAAQGAFLCFYYIVASLNWRDLADHLVQAGTRQIGDLQKWQALFSLASAVTSRAVLIRIASISAQNTSGLADVGSKLCPAFMR